MELEFLGLSHLGALDLYFLYGNRIRLGLSQPCSGATETACEEALLTAARQQEGKEDTPGQGRDEAQLRKAAETSGFLREHYQLPCRQLHPVNLAFAPRNSR